ncbi:MAG: FAD-dependent oxidoreductase, partial [Chloroflexota bacterium]
GSSEPQFFSFKARDAHHNGRMASAHQYCPIADFSAPAPLPGSDWRQQLDCFSLGTNGQTHDIIRRNLDRAPMYNGGITSVGPRYCPSIETKIVRFAEKESHPLFLEPEGWNTRETYIQGASTSLPEDVQLEMLRSIPALRRAEIMRAGYAIEYDYLPGTQVHSTLETKLLPNLFLAGQIIGTTGYEEAASLGLMAGINAARRAQDREGITLGRNQAYVGVLIDDLVTKEMDEPYRMHTSQAEFRLLLRQNNAEARLGGLGHRLGLVDDRTVTAIGASSRQVEDALGLLDSISVRPSAATNDVLREAGCREITHPLTGRELLCHQDVHLDALHRLGVVPLLEEQVAAEVETTVKYAGYVSRQESEVRRLAKLEEQRIPASFEYEQLRGLSYEAREKLAAIRPATVGQASRVGGVAPSDVSLLLVHLARA